MMLAEILNEKQEAKGTYAAVSFSTETKDALLKYISDNDIPTPVPGSKLHTTLLYSRKFLSDYEPAGKIDPPLIGKPGEFEAWETNGENSPKTRCLVLKFKCPELEARHEELMSEHQATFDYPEYKTHITLSYDIGDMDIDDLPSITDYLKEIEIVDEYGENLDTNWAKNKGVKKDD